MKKSAEAASGTAIFTHDSLPSESGSTSEWSGAQPECSSHTASVPRASPRASGPSQRSRWASVPAATSISAAQVSENHGLGASA